eukprot:2236566-Pleurochrysis_carterae.AAC.1
MATAAMCLQSWSRTLTFGAMTATAMTPPTMTILRQVALMSAPVLPARISTLRSRFVCPPHRSLAPPYTFI